jgi:hypothetical protein
MHAITTRVGIILVLLIATTVVCQSTTPMCIFSYNQIVTLEQFQSCLKQIPMQSSLYYRTILNNTYHTRLTLRNKKPSVHFIKQYNTLLDTMKSNSVLRAKYESDFEVHGAISKLFAQHFNGPRDQYRKPFCYSAFQFVLPIEFYESMEEVADQAITSEEDLLTPRKFKINNVTMEPLHDDFSHVYNQYMELYPPKKGHEKFSKYYKWQVTIVNGKKAVDAIQQYKEISGKYLIRSDYFTRRPANVFPVPDRNVYMNLKHFKTIEETTFKLHFVVLSKFEGDIHKLTSWCQTSVDDRTEYSDPKSYLETTNIAFLKPNTSPHQCLSNPDIQYLDEICEGNTFLQDDNCPVSVGHAYYGHICNPFTGRYSRNCILSECIPGYSMEHGHCIEEKKNII